MSDSAEWRIKRLRRHLDLQGWEPNGYFVQEAGALALPQSEPIGIRIIDVVDRSLGGKLDNELAKDVTFAVQYSDDQEITCSVRFSRVRETDLSTLPHVRKFLAERLGADDTDKWNDAYEALSKKAARDFKSRLDELTVGGRSASEDLGAWSRRYGEAMSEAQSFAYTPFQINGQYSQQLWDMVIHQFCLRDHERKIMDLVPGDGIRGLISDMFYQVAREAYVLGRWIRESEIVQDHGEVIEKGRKYKSEKHGGGVVSGGIKSIKADTWRVPGLELAKRIRSKDPHASQDAIARIIQDQIDGAPVSPRGVTGEISEWENNGYLDKRVKPANKKQKAKS